MISADCFANDKQSSKLSAKAPIELICGDIIGSCYEWQSTKRYDFKLLSEYSRFTDDTVCSVAMVGRVITTQRLLSCQYVWEERAVSKNSL